MEVDVWGFALYTLFIFAVTSIFKKNVYPYSLLDKKVISLQKKLFLFKYKLMRGKILIQNVLIISDIVIIVNIFLFSYPFVRFSHLLTLTYMIQYCLILFIKYIITYSLYI